MMAVLKDAQFSFLLSPAVTLHTRDTFALVRPPFICTQTRGRCEYLLLMGVPVLTGLEELRMVPNADSIQT